MRPPGHIYTDDFRVPRARAEASEEMPEKGWEDLPEHDVGEAPNRFDVDGFRARLFGGPGATLYGDSGIPGAVELGQQGDSRRSAGTSDL